jgi:hypothetical protein
MAAANGWQNYHVIMGTAAATLTGLLFVGIHNAWDPVTYFAVVRPQSTNK